MSRGAKVGLVVGVLFFVINLVAAVVVATWGEMMHAALHAALMVPGVLLIWRFAPNRAGSARSENATTGAASRDLVDRLTQIEQSVDSVAIEVERAGEGQRFMTRVFTENGTARASADAAADPVERAVRPVAAPLRQF